MQNTKQTDRAHLIYDNGYGQTSDVYMLPVGTTFTVTNGHWRGTILHDGDTKYLRVDETGHKIVLKPGVDYGLSLHNIKIPEPLNPENLPKNMHTIYISGKMSGVPDYNRPRFNEAARRLRDTGFTVINPAEISGDACWQWADYMRAALKRMMDADVLYVLEGYETSKGAAIEINLAEKLGMPIFNENEQYM